MRRSTNKESIIKFYESAMLKTKLEDLGYELMYLDKFSISFRQHTTYGWGPIGKKGFLDVNTDTFDMSFMIGFSKQRFYGMLGTSSSNNSKSFLIFIKNAIEYRINTLKIIGDKFIIVYIMPHCTLVKKLEITF